MSTEQKPTGNDGLTKVEADSKDKQPTAAHDEKLGPCFEFEFVFVERDTDLGNPTHRISTRVRVPVNRLMDVAICAAGDMGFKEAKAEITIAAYIHSIEHLCDDVQCTHPRPVAVASPALRMFERAYPETKGR